MEEIRGGLWSGQSSHRAGSTWQEGGLMQREERAMQAQATPGYAARAHLSATALARQWQRAHQHPRRRVPAGQSPPMRGARS